MPLLKCRVDATNLVGQADRVETGVLAKVYVPPNIAGAFTFQIEEVVDGYAHILYVFSAPASPASYILQRESRKADGAVSGSYMGELVGGQLQIRASAGVVGTFSLLVL